MDKRTLLALVLMAIVLVVTPMLFPSSRRPAPSNTDSTSKAPPSAAASTQPAVVAPVSSLAPQPLPANRATESARPQSPASITLATPKGNYLLLNPGAAPAAITVS